MDFEPIPYPLGRIAGKALALAPDRRTRISVSRHELGKTFAQTFVLELRGISTHHEDFGNAAARCPAAPARPGVARPPAGDKPSAPSLLATAH